MSTRSTTIGALEVGDVIVTVKPKRTLRVVRIDEFVDGSRDLTMVETVLGATFGPIWYSPDKVVEVEVVDPERLAYLEALSATYGTPIETLVADESRDRRGGYEGPGGYGR